MIDKGIYLIFVILIILLGVHTEREWLTIFLLLFVTVFGITLKLWLPRTIGMRLLGLVYVSNYDFLPVSKHNSIILYTSVEEYNNRFNKKQIGDFLSENTTYGFGLKISPLYTDYNQTRTMMINGVYLVKQNIYRVFREDYIETGKIETYLKSLKKGV